MADFMFAQEAGRGIGPVDLETLVSTAEVGDAQVMQKATEEDEFVVVVITSRCPTRAYRTSGSRAMYPSDQDTGWPRKVG
jgi:hypothetical protein